MATPEKTSTISFSSTTLSDSDLPITTFSKSDLTTFLNGVASGSNVTFFFASQGGTSSDVYLVLAEESFGTISGTNQLQSAKLPCPKFCK